MFGNNYGRYQHLKVSAVNFEGGVPGQAVPVPESVAEVRLSQFSRWFVLTPQALMTFKERKAYNSPTEVIPLRGVTSIKSADEETSK